VPKRPKEEKPHAGNGRGGADSVSAVLKWIDKGSLTMDELRRIEVAAARSRKSLVEKLPDRRRGPSESYHQKMVRGHLYWYKSFAQDGKPHIVYVGKELPRDLDQGLVSIAYYREKKAASK